MADICAALPHTDRVGTFTKNTKILISFGAVLGGFEFALQLRHDLMQQFNKLEDNAFVYIDAVSLAHDPETTYPFNEELGINKMQNPKWEEFYLSAMSNCKYMIFIITRQWLDSKWCWDEYLWFQRMKAEKPIIPFFIIFGDAKDILRGYSNHKDKTGVVRDVKEFSSYINRQTTFLEIAGRGETVKAEATIGTKKYKYTYQYTCDDAERRTILSKIKEHVVL